MHRYIAGCSNYIKDYVKQAGKEGVVIGLSGGLDSSLVAALSTVGLGKENVFGLIMPIAVDTPMPDRDDIECAEEVARWLGIRYGTMDLTRIYGQLYLDVQSGLGFDFNILTRANIAARLRMTTLMAMGEHLHYLNVGTGNKSELSIGYITKYGDGGVDFEPIGDIYKTEAYEVAKAISDFPKRVLERPPSAGLWKGQTDEGEIGMTYEELDAILMSIDGVRRHARIGCNEEKLFKNSSRVAQLVQSSNHKRHMPPTFSADEYRK